MLHVRGADGGTTERRRVAIVGAGIGGLALAIGLLDDGIDDFVVLERSDGIGGTWRHNTYPGRPATCPRTSTRSRSRPTRTGRGPTPASPRSSTTSSGAPTTRGVRPHVRTGWRVTTRRWSEADRTWTLDADDGRRVVADVVVFATGMFDEPRPPDIEGVDVVRRRRPSTRPVGTTRST